MSGVELGPVVDDVTQVLVVPVDGSEIVEAVNLQLVENNIPAEQIYVERGRLDDVFRQITSEGDAQ